MQQTKQVSAVQKSLLAKFYKEANELSKYGRVISDKDLIEALQFMESQQPPFHISRVKNLQLEREQPKPPAYTDDQGFFVISKITPVTEVNKSVFYDWTIKQVYFQYEKFVSE